jgi:hypothetical protein
LGSYTSARVHEGGGVSRGTKTQILHVDDRHAARREDASRHFRQCRICAWKDPAVDPLVQWACNVATDETLDHALHPRSQPAICRVNARARSGRIVDSFGRRLRQFTAGAHDRCES